MLENTQFQTLNVKVIVQETGMKPETLRAWERRYGLPRPQRSQGGHRLYSRRDIEIVKWLLARQAEGLSISNAVDLWNSLENQGGDPLQMAGYTNPAGKAPASEIGTLDNLRNAWVEACMVFDEQKAEQILTQAFAIYAPETVCVQLMGAGLAQIGDGWYAGKITVQQEHFASALALRRLEALIAAAPAPTRAGRILVAAPADENHDFILLILTFLLRRRGRDVVYLGSNLPLEHLEGVIQSTQPRLVVSAVQQLHTAARLLEMARLLAKKSVSLAYGGRIINLLPRLRARIPGYFLGENLEEVPLMVDHIMTTSNHKPPIEEISHDYEVALEHFRVHLPEIEAHLWRNLRQVIDHDHMAIANLSIARDIDAALVLGDITFLGNEIAWVDGLLVNQGISRQALRTYLEIYRQAAHQYLDQRANPVLAWLDQVCQVIRME